MSERRDGHSAAHPHSAAQRPHAGAGHAAPASRRAAAHGGGAGAIGWLRGQLSRRPLPVWVLVVADVLVFAVALNVFALFHHVLPRHEQAVGISSQRAGGAAISTQAPAADAGAAQADPAADPLAAQADAAPQATQVPEDPEGYFGTKFADKFTDGAVETDIHSYRSANICATLSDHRDDDVDYHVVDFYVRDISCFQTAFARDTFGRGMYESVGSMIKRLGAVAGINGDFYGGRSDGIVARNGTLYRDDENPKRDVCVLYWDGRMETYSPEGFDAEAEMQRGAYQIWNFGPMLLDENAQAMEKFNTDVNPTNPRSALGYYEPGHYCLVAVDGRSKASSGLTMQQLSQLMQKLGCVRGYNLDGGDSTVMGFNGNLANVPSGGGRECTDLIALIEP